MDAAFLELVGKYGVLPAVVLYGLSIMIPKMLAARTGATEETARTDVIELLVSRVTALEKAQKEAWDAFQAERDKRVVAEDKVATLARRVSLLEDQIRRLGHEPAGA